MKKCILNDGYCVKSEDNYCNANVCVVEESKLRKLLLKDKQPLTKAEHEERRLKAYKPKK